MNHLSKAEKLVAEHVAKGYSNKEIAEMLFVTEKTVKFHLTNIYKKEDVKSRAQLIVKFRSAEGLNGSIKHNREVILIRQTEALKTLGRFRFQVEQLQKTIEKATTILAGITESDLLEEFDCAEGSAAGEVREEKIKPSEDVLPVGNVSFERSSIELSGIT
ncbi:response regulator transcription factor [Bdellovibrio bacteriovorus]|uniref:response regulator transcription factor n=1 Tax=Bdellovibrio bacteriovorus TaxID=959 RepID=UPI0035A585B5